MFPEQCVSGVAMRRITVGPRDDLLKAVASRYRSLTHAEKGGILTEFADTPGYHHKHVERPLRCEDAAIRPRTERVIHDFAVREA